MQPIAIPQRVLDRLPARGPHSALTLGLIGGGQLAKMIAQSALQLGCDVAVLERNNHSPAANLATHTVVGDWDNPESLLKLASLADVITLENEFVAADSLAALEEFDYPLYPASSTIRVVQDKFTQKQLFRQAGLPVPPFADAPNPDSVIDAARQFGWPVVLKKRRNGYDGKGNATVRSADELPAAWARLGGEEDSLYVEAWCPFTRELAIMITRARDGSLCSYPLVETIQQEHICHVVEAPANVSGEVAAAAIDIARRAVEAAGAVGSVGMELFLTEDNMILINEMAPRVHNSGHYTIEACECSQFENHVRAVMGWPLGSTTMRSPAAVMINLLGVARGGGRPHGLEQALAVPGAHVHVYGKAMSVPGRKMGHVTALGRTADEALSTARRAADAIRFGGAA